MVRRLARFSALLLLIIGGLTFIAWVSSPDPKYNPASFEEEPIEASLADLSEAITLAQYKSGDGETVTLLVEAYEGELVTGIDLADLGAPRNDDPFAVLAAIEDIATKVSESAAVERKTVNVAALLPSGPTGSQHLGIGTNFPEHAEEAQSSSVFNFPKFGTATPARTTVSAQNNGLLDYEIELCMRFDRPIASLADFDAAVKGIFLCGDFTDRIKLLKLIDLDNFDSGYGFSDAKSGPDFFPTGPFLVIPHDWKSFVSNTRMITHLNDHQRQDARGHEMTLDFRALTENVLGDMERARFYYQGDYYKLAPNGRIEQDMTLMSGTSEGVIFTTPRRHDYIEIIIGYVLKGGPLSGQDFMDMATQIFIDNERAGGHFLKSGDIVQYQASHLGDIKVEVR
jgi:2-keto-4-pentenoate hydratase/2-oxohepta-3-ene-1,7-dioic acid hydratase in catechol pathway